jgi:hypothetical protein
VRSSQETDLPEEGITMTDDATTRHDGVLERLDAS